MIQKNKISGKITRALIPTYLFITMLPSAGAVIIGAESAKEKDETAQNKMHGTAAMLSVMTLALAVMFTYFYLRDNKLADKFSAKTAKKYIKSAIKEYPNLRDFESVLSNERALNHVATMISNNLRPSEQKLILDKINEMNLYPAYAPDKQMLKDTITLQKYILQIVNEHVAVQPDFIDDIYITMANADHLYVMPMQRQLTR